MEYITNEQLEDFLSTITKKLHRDAFYDLFLDYLENNHINIYDENAESKLEQEVYQIAVERNLIGYNVICELNDIKKFVDIMVKITKRNQYNLFHLIHETDDSAMSTTAFWEKWNQVPPLGWLGGWCSCGEFFPLTFDMGEMNLEEDSYQRLFEGFRPKKIKMQMVDSVSICSDGFFRLRLKTGETIAVRPYKFDTGFSFNFVENPLSLLE